MHKYGMGIALLVLGAIYTPVVLLIMWGVMNRLHEVIK